MTVFNDLFAWADENPFQNRVHTCMSVVYDKANREETAQQSPDFAASSQGLLGLDDDLLVGRFDVTFSDRLIRDGGTWQTGRRDPWDVRLRRDGGIELAQTNWRIDWTRLTDVRRIDVGSADFAVGHFQNRSTRALLSFSFDKIFAGAPI